MTKTTYQKNYFLTNCHLYNYCSNNPVRYVDPDGEFPLVPIIISVTTIGIGEWMYNEQHSDSNEATDSPYYEKNYVYREGSRIERGQIKTEKHCWNQSYVSDLRAEISVGASSAYSETIATDYPNGGFIGKIFEGLSRIFFCGGGYDLLTANAGIDLQEGFGVHAGAGLFSFNGSLGVNLPFKDWNVSGSASFGINTGFEFSYKHNESFVFDCAALFGIRFELRNKNATEEEQ